MISVPVRPRAGRRSHRRRLAEKVVDAFVWGGSYAGAGSRKAHGRAWWRLGRLTGPSGPVFVTRLQRVCLSGTYSLLNGLLPGGCSVVSETLVGPLVWS